MTIATCISLIGTPDSYLYNLILKADKSVQYELFKLIEEQQISCKLIYENFTTEKLREGLVVTYENANRKRIEAKNQDKVNLCKTWETIVNILDLACEYLEDDAEDNFYLLY